MSHVHWDFAQEFLPPTRRKYFVYLEFSDHADAYNELVDALSAMRLAHHNNPSRSVLLYETIVMAEIDDATVPHPGQRG